MEKFNSINNSLNADFSAIEDATPLKSTKRMVKGELNETDIRGDYEYTRANLYSLISKGQEAIDGILELASEGESARTYEVAGQLIKHVGDVADKLMDLQKKLKDVEEENDKKAPNSVTNNALFVGTTAELSEIIKKGFLNSKDTDDKKK